MDHIWLPDRVVTRESCERRAILCWEILTLLLYNLRGPPRLQLGLELGLCFFPTIVMMYFVNQIPESNTELV